MSLVHLEPQNRIGHWINGRLEPGAVLRTAPVYDPAQGRAVREVALAEASDVERAVAAARAAAVEWADWAPQRRARVLFKFKDLVDRHTADLARLITLEHGKTLPDAAGEVQRGLDVIEFD